MTRRLLISPVVAAVLVAAVASACGAPEGIPVDAGAPGSTASVPSTAPTVKQWFVPASKMQAKVPAGAGNASPDAARTSGTALSAEERAAIPTKRAELGPSDPLVKSVSATLAAPQPLNYASRVDGDDGPTYYVSFGRHGAATLTIIITQLKEPTVPTLGDDAAFKAGYQRRADGVEQFTDNPNRAGQFAIRSVTPPGRQIVVAAESPPSMPALATPDQVRAVTDKLLAAQLPIPN